ncbi:MAG: InlB B-repeat-containing protein, partial [Kofleriaceae bacterium]|nr:InlB B-repeat-containing protein [Kofleriaceae bacterium]
PGSCSQKFDHGTTVTLTAFAYAGSTFTGWSGGGCSGTGTCSVLMTAARTVTANFTRPILTVTKFGNGTGTVTSSPAGISCGGDCTEAVNAGTTVTLTATPAAGTQFMGWVGGGCSGMGTCTTTITASTTVRANFYLTIHQVTVTKTGGGTGWVATSPLSGIACGTDCSEYYYYGTSVTLYATPDPGSTFTGWTGACTGLGPCTFTIVGAPGQAYPVTANFAPSS